MKSIRLKCERGLLPAGAPLGKFNTSKGRINRLGGFSDLRAHKWRGAQALGQGADAFLGTQGDVRDTQWNMCWRQSARRVRCVCSVVGMTGSWRASV